MNELEIGRIVVPLRRHTVGDLHQLIRSIRNVGLLRPVVITPENMLLSGERRLAALVKLRVESTPVIVVETLGEAAKQMRGDRECDIAQRPLLPSEMAHVVHHLREFDAPFAAQRLKERIAKAAATRRNGIATQPPRGSSVVLDQIAEGVGVGRTTINRLMRVYQALIDPKVTVETRELALDCLNEMDQTGVITPASERFLGDAKTRGAPTVRISLPAKQRNVTKTATEQRRIIGAATATLTGLTKPLDDFGALADDVTNEEAAQWLGSLVRSQKILNRIITTLRERT